MEKKIIYESNTIKVKMTGQDYDFIATIENKIDFAITVVFSSEYDNCLNSIDISPNDQVGILADDKGKMIIEALSKRKFLVCK